MSYTVHTILLVDNDDITNYYNRVILEDDNFAENIVEQYSSEEAIEYLKNEDNPIPDIIILDINMPIMNGWDFLDHIVANNIRGLDHFKIFMLTASMNPNDEDRMDKYDCVSGFLIKPLEIDKLKAAYFSE